MFLAHKTTLMALSFSIPKHSLPSHFTSKSHLNVFPLPPSFLSLNHGFRRLRRAKFSAVATQITETPTASPPGKAHDTDSSDGRIVLPTNQSSERLLRIRHTCAHVMAMAVQKVYPDAKVTIGPWIDNGFYYDFDMEPLTDKDLKKIKKEMVSLLSRCNEWWDLCAGPHVESTGNINRKAVELESVAGAYWRGDTNKPMLQGYYGTAWETEEQLKAYLHFKEEAKRRITVGLAKILICFLYR
ncbi:UNVERIFIED_CONTAM: Threonine--tRNA ligase, chloroplastic/mitochondrial 2 [Sesamum radiatum]|uniref:Threonine--tRNA ligase, chloroplastic/mitochondrial 2 n=1 Tax=Sesamum radiatum TaxID=300843 RepID=A0AAW2K523_SESRA